MKKLQKSDEMIHGDVQYEDIFSKNIQKQKQVAALYDNFIEIRNRIMNDSLPVACTGPLQSTPTLQNHSVP